MNSHQEQCFSDFDALISPWASAYQCAVISYVGVKTAQGRRLLFGRVLLEPTRNLISDTAFTFETEHFVAARFVSDVTPSAVKAIIEKAKSGEIPTMDGTTGLSIQTQGNLSTYFSPIYHPFISEGPRLPSLQVTGISKHNLIASIADSRVLDWELKAAETPFENLDELLSRCSLPTEVQMGTSTTLEIVAKSPATVAGTSIITGRHVRIECQLAGALDIAKLRLGYKIFQNDFVDRNSVGGSALNWRQEGEIKIGTYQMEIGSATLLQAFVSYAGVSQHQGWITDPQKRLNPRYAIHQVFDEDMELLKRMLLKPDTDKPYVFENAVSTLLDLLGFSVSNYGRIPKLQRGPDIIAISPAGHVGVVECTVGLLDENDKMAKVVQRAKLIRDKLNGSGYGFLRLQAVIVTPLSREEVTANLETAAKHDIAVVCKEDIEEMLNQTNLPPNADRLFEDAKRLIPNSGQGSLLSNDT